MSIHHLTAGGLTAAGLLAGTMALRVAFRMQSGRPQPLFARANHRASLVWLLAGLSGWLLVTAALEGPGAAEWILLHPAAEALRALAAAAALATVIQASGRRFGWALLTALVIPPLFLLFLDVTSQDVGPLAFAGQGQAGYAISCAGAAMVGTILVYHRRWRSRRLEAAGLLGAVSCPLGFAAVNLLLPVPEPIFEVVPMAAVGSVMMLAWVLEIDRQPRLLSEAGVGSLDLLGNGVLIVDDRRLVVAASTTAREMLGLPDDLGGLKQGGAVLPSQLVPLLADPDAAHGEFAMLADGTRRHFEVSISPLRGDRWPRGARSLALRETTSTREIEDRLTRLAYYDNLTGLANRRHFMDTLAAEIEKAEAAGCTLGLLYFDLDGFKEINDNLGHAAGDALLRAIAQRLRQELRKARAKPVVREIARIGGDEFAVLLTENADPDDDQIIAERILQTICKPLWVDDQDVFNRASIGIARFPRDGRNPEALISRADAALYCAKARGGNCYDRFRPEQAEVAQRTAETKQRLASAVAAGELDLHYQPKFDLASQELVGCEALLRWDSAHLGKVSPARFIPLSEGTPLIAEITRWVVAEACRQIAAWQANDLELVPVAINVPGPELSNPDFIEWVVSSLREHEVDPGLLEIEITERSFIDDLESASVTLRELRRMGIAIALDDFGTGYSALASLTSLPLDSVKLDRGFIRDMRDDPAVHGVIQAVVSMCHSLGLKVVAEGIDDPALSAALLDLGCDQAQGFALGEPVPATAFENGQWERESTSHETAEPRASASESNDDDLPGFSDSELPAVAGAKPQPGSEISRYALLIDDEQGSLGPVALRLTRLGVLVLYTRFPDEALLLAGQEKGRIRSVVISPATPLDCIRRAMQRLAASGAEEAPTLAVVGSRPDEARCSELRAVGANWALWAPLDDSELRFVVNSAMALPYEVARRTTPRAPTSLVASVSASGRHAIGNLSSLS
ncbi:MAG: EAL domain-containing protein, partial [bacterium]|nr:EAL domain-containing protein [bacterium]